MQYKTFVFSPFQENTYVVWDETLEAVIIDAGNFFDKENNILDDFISENKLQIKYIVNTHNHLDHIFGMAYLQEKYKVEAVSHPDDIFWIDRYEDTCKGYGLPVTRKPIAPKVLVNDNEIIQFGNSSLKVIHVPGHSPGGIALYSPSDSLLFAGDILFNGSVGRSDLPGGNHDTLIDGILSKLMVLPEETKVLCGHGNETTIGLEKDSNPFLQ